MQNYEDAATHMQLGLNEKSYLVGNEDVLRNIRNVKALTIFSDEVISFFDALSKELLSYSNVRDFPDVVAYAFWIRKASLGKIAEDYYTDKTRIGRGVSFHIAPSNIPIQFAVSMTYALVAGNAAVIRISNKEFIQTEYICNAINNVLENGNSNLKPYICIVRYNHDKNITQTLTDICDIRMIWGGDQTINKIRELPVPPRCIDLGFSDRYSISIVDSDDYLTKDPETIAKSFYNDTYFFDQNACSSPRIVIWIGRTLELAQERFWNTLHRIAIEKYKIEDITASDKLLTTTQCAMRFPGVREIKDDNYLVRLKLKTLNPEIMKYKGNCGYFFEYDAGDLEEVIPLLEKECQTITYIGNIEDNIRKLIKENGVRGCDRIVPVGHGGDISFIWDGIDLPMVLSRVISEM